MLEKLHFSDIIDVLVLLSFSWVLLALPDTQRIRLGAFIRSLIRLLAHFLDVERGNSLLLMVLERGFPVLAE